MDRLQDFFKTVDSTEPLSDSEVLSLCRRARAGEEQARDQIWRAHLRLIAHIAKRFFRSDGFFEWGDLMQLGSMGLLRAIERFDPAKQCSGRPVSFALYATYWIAHAIRRDIQNRGRTIKLPVYLQQELMRWKQELKGMREGCPRSKAQVERLALAEHSFSPIEDHLKEEEDGHRHSLVLWLGDWDSHEQELVQHEIGLAVRQLVADLPDRESYIVQQHYGLQGAEASEVGLPVLAQKLGISSERVRQLQNRALDRLKQVLKHHPELHPDTV